MAITTSGTSITFNDATTQTTAPVNTSANVNSVSAGTGVSVNATTGAVTVTNAGVTSVAAGTGISVSASTGGVTITNTSPSSGGTVTSVATGNGLSGGTITSTGTLVIACPGFNTVGSYAYCYFSSSVPTSGSNYSAGGGANQIQSAISPLSSFNNSGSTQNNLSGTWKWMGSSQQGSCGSQPLAIACRVA